MTSLHNTYYRAFPLWQFSAIVMLIRPDTNLRFVQGFEADLIEPFSVEKLAQFISPPVALIVR